MKKLITSTLLLFLAIQVFGQLNPVKDFQFEHWYSYGSPCPGYNCFSLDWGAPDVSVVDTLVGYNIYRDSELWRFQEYIGAGCSEEISPCPDESFFDFSETFWIKVKAVYNSALLESPALDSAHFDGHMIGIEKKPAENKIIYPNPTDGIVTIDIENIRKIEVINSSGTKIQATEGKSIVDLRNAAKGVYYFKIITDKEVRIEKVVLE